MTYLHTSPDLTGKSRAERFLVLRDAILARSNRMRSDGSATRTLACGPFCISVSFPGPFDRSKCNVQIWPEGAQSMGHVVYGDKVANVNWDHQDRVEIVTFKSGPWEDILLGLLRDENVDFLKPLRSGP